LASLGDNYAPLALGVVQNNTVDGVFANAFAKTVAQQNNISITSDQWTSISTDLMQADYNARAFQFQLILTTNDPTFNIEVTELSVTAMQQ